MFRCSLNLLRFYLNNILSIGAQVPGTKLSRWVYVIVCYRWNGYAFYSSPFVTRYSAICMAFVAAPFLRLSLTTHMFNVFG